MSGELDRGNIPGGHGNGCKNSPRPRQFLNKSSDLTQNSDQMSFVTRYVIRRDGRKVPVNLEEVVRKITKLSEGLQVDPTAIAQKVIANIYDGISTAEIDAISAETASMMEKFGGDYIVLAKRLLVEVIHRQTPATFRGYLEAYDNGKTVNREMMAWFYQNEATIEAAINHSRDHLFTFGGLRKAQDLYLDKREVPTDSWSLFGKPMEVTAEMRRIGGVPTTTIEGVPVKLKRQMKQVLVDRPQYLFMREAIAVTWPEPEYSPDGTLCRLPRTLETYERLSRMRYTHATPTLFNAMKSMQLMSCMLGAVADNSESILRTSSNCGNLSRNAVGIGLCYQDVREAGAPISGSNGTASGPCRQLIPIETNLVTFDQNGRRPGSAAIYIEPTHPEIRQFLQMKLNSGSEKDLRARKLYYAVWWPDYILERISAGQPVPLFSPLTAPGLGWVYDGMRVCTKCDYCSNFQYAKWLRDDCREIDEHAPAPALPHQATCDHTFVRKKAYRELFHRYLEDGMAVGAISAVDMREIHCRILRESGMPYRGYKDVVNRRNNQAWLTIRCSNLCTEIVEYCSSTSYASCCLASLNLQAFVIEAPRGEDATISQKQVPFGRGLAFDFDKFEQTVASVVRSLDNVIDVNVFPTPESTWNSRNLRPIGLGIQGFADIVQRGRIEFLSDEAVRLRLSIFESMYFAAARASAELARERGSHYGFEHSLAAAGQLPMDTWAEEHADGSPVSDYPHKYLPWNHPEELRKVCRDGMRNSLLVAPMPTVSTAEMLGNNESFEPFHANIFAKNSNSRQQIVTNRHMISHLTELGLWSEQMFTRIATSEGSIADIETIPADVRAIYAIAFELSQKKILEVISLMGKFIDQASSNNVWLKNNTDAAINAVFDYESKLKNKTGYYVRSKAAAAPMKNVRGARGGAQAPVRKAAKTPQPPPKIEGMVCRMEEGCINCGS